MPQGNGLTFSTMTSSPQIVWLGNLKVPRGDAAAIYTRSLVKAAELGGWSCLTLGWKTGEPDPEYNFVEIPTPSSKDVLSGAAMMHRLESLDLSATRAIVCYHAPALLMLRLRKFCRSRGIAFIAVVTEWYDFRRTHRGLLGATFYDSELRMFLNKKVDGLVCISERLRSKYEGSGPSIKVVPPLIDTHAEGFRSPRIDEVNEKIRLVYAGSPGAKELLGKVIDAVADLREVGCPFTFTFVGFGENRLAETGAKPESLTYLRDRIETLGRLSHAETLNVVKSGDYSIIARPNRRDIQVAFPSKLPESLALGTPAIVTDISDVRARIGDRNASIILEGFDSAAIRKGLEQALHLSDEERIQMRRGARLAAEELFSIQSQSAEICTWFNQVIESKR